MYIPVLVTHRCSILDKLKTMINTISNLLGRQNEDGNDVSQQTYCTNGTKHNTFTPVLTLRPMFGKVFIHVTTIKVFHVSHGGRVIHYGQYFCF